MKDLPDDKPVKKVKCFDCNKDLSKEKVWKLDENYRTLSLCRNCYHERVELYDNGGWGR